MNEHASQALTFCTVENFYNHYAARSLCRIEMLTIENTSTDSFDVSEHMKVIALANC